MPFKATGCLRETVAMGILDSEVCTAPAGWTSTVMPVHSVVWGALNILRLSLSASVCHWHKLLCLSPACVDNALLWDPVFTILAQDHGVVRHPMLARDCGLT